MDPDVLEGGNNGIFLQQKEPMDLSYFNFVNREMFSYRFLSYTIV